MKELVYTAIRPCHEHHANDTQGACTSIVSTSLSSRLRRRCSVLLRGLRLLLLRAFDYGWRPILCDRESDQGILGATARAGAIRTARSWTCVGLFLVLRVRLLIVFVRVCADGNKSDDVQSGRGRCERMSHGHRATRRAQCVIRVRNGVRQAHIRPRSPLGLPEPPKARP